MNKFFLELKNLDKDTYKIIYKCDKCGIIKKNKIADDDNFEKILEIMKNKE